jgi:mRNA interferase RelE/StbE
MKVELSQKAEKMFLGMDTITAGRIMQAILKIPKGDIMPLKGSPESFRLRVGEWRILFTQKDKGLIFIEKIASRGSAYKE